jgi:hypothetical protein
MAATRGRVAREEMTILAVQNHYEAVAIADAVSESVATAEGARKYPPNAHGEQQPEASPPPGPKTVLIFAGACGAVAGYFAHDWRTGTEVFAVIVALFTDQR